MEVDQAVTHEVVNRHALECGRLHEAVADQLRPQRRGRERVDAPAVRRLHARSSPRSGRTRPRERVSVPGPLRPVPAPDRIPDENTTLLRTLLVESRWVDECVQRDVSSTNVERPGRSGAGVRSAVRPPGELAGPFLACRVPVADEVGEFPFDSFRRFTCATGATPPLPVPFPGTFRGPGRWCAGQARLVSRSRNVGCPADWSWALRVSIPRLPPCKGGALPTELNARAIGQGSGRWN